MTPRLEGDAFARHVIRHNLDESLIVEASAGTGKTTELVNRIVAVLRAGRTTIEHIVAVTFTHKAAGELKVRLRQELDQAREGASGEELDNLERAIGRLEEAAIGTIHSFCAQVLRERPVEARIDPAFEELQEKEQQRIYDRAYRHWLERALNEERPGLRRALSRLAWTTGAGELPPSEQLRIEGKKIVEWRDFRAPWGRDPQFDRLGEMRDLARRAKALAHLCDLCPNPKDRLKGALRPVRDFTQWLDRWKGVRQSPDPDAVEALLLRLLADLKRLKDSPGKGQFSPQVTREEVVRQREDLMAGLAVFKVRADADFAADLQANMLDLIDRYEEAKQRSGKLDFVDLLVKVRDLVAGNPEVRRHLQRRYTHFFIDEFQDTDPVQAEVLLLLACDDPEASDWRLAAPTPGKLFLVGDPKQSIYKFRRADVLLYQKVCETLCGQGVRKVEMSVSHRSSVPIQQCVNAAFAPEMQESAARGQSGYVPLTGERQPIANQPAVVVLPPPRPWGKRQITKTAIDKCLPDATAAFIEWLTRKSGWKVRAPGEETLVPVEERHIAVLFRRFVNYGEDITRGYVRNFEARGIGHLLVGSKSFHQREEVDTLRAACAAVEWPSDELSVYATLKGPLFAVHDNLLLRYRMEVGHLHPMRPPSSGDERKDFETIDSVLALLAELHRERNERPVAETLNRMLEAARAHAGFALRPGGHQVISNVYRLSDLARNYELTGGISFRGFVEELAERAERVDSSEAPMVEESAEGVRLMTVHTAKGLEFPVVILGDMTANIAARDPDRYLDPERRLCALRLLRCAPRELAEHDAEERAREEAEGVRVAYVAATRARDLLVIPAVGDQQMAGNWVSPLNKALYPAVADYRGGRLHPACPVVGDRTVLPSESAKDGGQSVRPAEHRPEHGEHTVVWWDPAALRLGVDAKLGLATFEALKGTSDASLAPYREWQAERARGVERGKAPEFEIANPTDMPDAPPGIGVEVLWTPIAGGERPCGARFGTLVHLLLRDSVAHPESLERTAQSYGRAFGAADDELAAAVAAARAALEHPLLERARSASRLLREAPVSLRIDEGHWMEGAIDLAFEDNGVWHIVDYKTDAPAGARLKQYQRQVAWYGAALNRVTGLPVRCYLLSL